MSRRPGREAALVLAGFATLAVLWTWPLAPRPRTTMAAPFGDPLLNSWIGRIRALWPVLGSTPAVPTTLLSGQDRFRRKSRCSNRRNRTVLQLLAGNRDRK